MFAIAKIFYCFKKDFALLIECNSKIDNSIFGVFFNSINQNISIKTHCEIIIKIVFKLNIGLANIEIPLYLIIYGMVRIVKDIL